MSKNNKSTVKFSINGTHYLARAMDLPDLSKLPVAPEVSHLMFLVDRSGSMYGTIDQVKSDIEKLLTRQEFDCDSMLITLISYSSQGDYTVHFSRVSVADIQKPKSKEMNQIRKLEATCLTCGSQALSASIPFIQKDETTGIVFFTDGYFNDRSPAQEVAEFDRIIQALKPYPNVFMNTIGYGWADFNLLQRLANELSGQMIKAGNLKDIYNSLHDTQELLAGRTLPSIVLSNPEGDFQSAWIPSRRKINGSTEDIRLRGVTQDDWATTERWRFRKVGLATYQQDSAPEFVWGASSDLARPILVFIRASMAAGRVNDAKRAIRTVGLADLMELRNSLVAEDLAEISKRTEEYLLGSRDFVYADPDTSPDIDGQAVLSILGDNTEGWVLNLNHLRENYKNRMSVKSLPGRLEGGKFVPVNTELWTEPDEWVSVSGFQTNMTNPNIQMNIEQPAELYRDQKKVTTVAGIKLKLNRVSSYTLVSGGKVNIPELKIQVSDKNLLTELKSLFGTLADSWKVGKDILIPTSLLNFEGSVQSLPSLNLWREMMTLRIKESFYAALIPKSESSSVYSPEQVEELKAYNITPNLNYSAPTSVPYMDKTQALTQGLIDTRTVPSIEFWGYSICGFSEAYSGNEAISRYATIPGNNAPKGHDLLTAPLYANKVVKNQNEVDNFQMPIVRNLMQDLFLVDIPDRIEYAKNALKDIRKKSKLLMRSTFTPAAFSIGAAGMIPEVFGNRLTLAEVQARGFKPSKSKQGGSYWVAPDGLALAVFLEVKEYSTDRGLEEIRKILDGEMDSPSA